MRINKFIQFAFIALALILPAFSHAISLNTFSNLFENSLEQSDYKLSSKEKSLVPRFNYLLVGGFGNEIAQLRKHNYLAPNAEALTEMGARNVDIFYPSSLVSISDGIPAMYEALLETYKNGRRKPIIAYGHSRGGLLLVATVLKHPELIIDGIIEKIITIQSPLTGSHLADQSVSILGPLSRLPFFKGMVGLTTEEIKKVVEDKIAELPYKVRRELSKHVFYVTSAQHRSELSPILHVGVKLFDLMDVKNTDGVMATHDMWIPKFGKVLGHINADHLELVIPEHESIIKTRPNTAKAFTFTSIKLAMKDEAHKIRNPKSHNAERPQPASIFAVCVATLFNILRLN